MYICGKVSLELCSVLLSIASVERNLAKVGVGSGENQGLMIGRRL